MNTYVVAYISFFDNAIQQGVVLSENPVMALLEYVKRENILRPEDVPGLSDFTDFTDFTDPSALEKLSSLFFDMDSTFSILQIK